MIVDWDWNPVPSIPALECFVSLPAQQSQSPELSASLSLDFVQLKGRKGYWAPPLRDPSGPGGGRGGGCSCSTASSEFLQIINWPRCC